MEDIVKKKEQASKKKSSSTALIVIGSILLFIALILVGLNLLSIYGSNTLGNIDNNLAGMYGCCISIAGLFGLVGLILLVIGIIKRGHANQELNAAEETNKILRMQMIAEENKKSEEKK